jgi:hypothetical protein
MPWGVAAAVVGAAGSAYSASQAKGPDAGPSEALLQNSVTKATRDYNPYMNAGKTAEEQMLNQLGLGTGKAVDISTLPGYSNILNQGINAVNQGYAGGGLLGGNALRALQQTGMNTASSYYNDYMNRLYNISNQGFNATSNLANLRAGETAQAAQLAYTNSVDQENLHNAQLGEYSNAFSSALGAGAGYMESKPSTNWSSMQPSSGNLDLTSNIDKGTGWYNTSYSEFNLGGQ